MHGEVMIIGNSGKPWPKCQMESTGTFCASLRHIFDIYLPCLNEPWGAPCPVSVGLCFSLWGDPPVGSLSEDAPGMDVCSVIRMCCWLSTLTPTPSKEHSKSSYEWREGFLLCFSVSPLRKFFDNSAVTIICFSHGCWWSPEWEWAWLLQEALLRSLVYLCRSTRIFLLFYVFWGFFSVMWVSHNDK